MFGKRVKYPVSEAQAKERMRGSIKMLGYGVIFALAAITGFHAVMIVLSETAAFTFYGQTGLVLLVLTIARLGFPLLVEAAAIIHVYGALNGVWKGDQKSWGGRIDATWLLFAALNMITFFAIERGQSLENWQVFWLQVGLPVSGIVAGVLVTKMILADPAHKRAEEEAAAEEEQIGNEHAVQSEVENSDAMQLVLTRRVWRDYANGLKAKGYDDEEIDFILAHVPALSDKSVARPTREEYRPSLVDRAKVQLGLSEGAGNSTHDIPRQPTLDATPQPGQGERAPTPNGNGTGPNA